MAPWLALPLLLRAAAIRVSSELGVELVAGVPILLPGRTEGQLVVNAASTWLLSLNKPIDQARLAEILETVDRCGFFNEHVNVIEYFGTKEHLEADLNKVSFASDVSVATLDTIMGVIPNVPELSARAAKTSDGTWGLKRVGAAGSWLDGRGIHVFVVDTGIMGEHIAFGGRVVPEFDFDLGGQIYSGACADFSGICAEDKHGHGTHVAGVIGGEGVGVAPAATLHSVRVLDGKGSGKLSGLVRGLNHIISSKIDRSEWASGTAVATLSVQAHSNQRALDDVIRKVIDEGVAVVVAAGNHDRDACEMSPASSPDIFVVAAADQERRAAQFTNFGSCVNLFAPGVGVETTHRARHYKLDAKLRQSGSTLAAAHVSGAMALLLQHKPGLGARELTAEVLLRASADTLLGDLHGSPNKDLHVGGDLARQCGDVISFRDAQGWSCRSWSLWSLYAPGCTKGKTYSEEELLEVRDNCRLSCRSCSVPWGV